MIGYRKDIDGLRAIAVLAVIFYHANIPFFSGGYVGVDIFFVISGYLITRVIQQDIHTQTFSLWRFYERRARRILPALFFMLAATFLVAHFLSTPQDYANFASSAVAATAFLGNVFFFLKTNYFDASADFQPLLHTWSLAVEEQFYIFLPLLLIFAARRGGVKWVLWALFFLSFLASLFITPIDQKQSFYGLHTRAWELLAGSLLAIGVFPALASRAYNQILSLCGMGLIFLAIITYTEDTMFPGASALLPCLGAVMIIWAGMGGKSTYVSQFLCLRPMIFVGLISYSLYLWHWPILAFMRQLRSQTILPLLDVGVALVLSFLLAVMSWRYVEQPFRQSSFLSRQRIFTLSIVASFVFMGLGFATYMMNGWPHRLSPELQRIAMGAEDVDQKRLSCNRRTPEDGLCTAGPADAPSSVLLWGDSHAGAMVPALQHIVSTQQEKLTYATHEACLPLTGVQRAGQGKSCARFNEAVLTWLETSDHSIQKVVLLGRWALSATGERLPGEAGAAVRLETIGSVYLSPTTAHDNPALLEMGLAATLERLDKIGVEVVLLGGVPERGQNVPRTLFHQTRFALPNPSLSLQDVQKRHGLSHAILTNRSKEDHVQYIPLDHFICTPDCLMVHDDYPLYYDDNHLSVYGAAEIFGPKLVPYFRPSYMTLVSASK